MTIVQEQLHDNSSPHYHIPTATNGPMPDTVTTTILRHNTAAAFHRTLPFYAPTPLIDLPGLAGVTGVGNITLKDESYRFGLNAFKALGASYAINQLLQQQPHLQTFCTATDGNHGRAVAWSAAIAGKKAVVFVPQNTTPNRIRVIEQEGATVIKIADNYEATCNHAAATSIAEGWQLVQDTAWPGYEEVPAFIMAGYLTHFAEMENNAHRLPEPGIDIVFLQAGVGSWAAAAVWYYVNRYGSKRPKIVMVEPAASDGLLTSFRQGKRTPPSGNQQTIMAGLNCGIPSSSAWEILRHHTDAIIAIEDQFAIEAMRMLYNPSGSDPRIIAGESGAAGLAGFLALMSDSRYAPVKTALGIHTRSRILLYSTEGATDPDDYRAIVGTDAVI